MMLIYTCMIRSRTTYQYHSRLVVVGRRRRLKVLSSHPADMLGMDHLFCSCRSYSHTIPRDSQQEVVYTMNHHLLYLLARSSRPVDCLVQVPNLSQPDKSQVDMGMYRHRLRVLHSHIGSYTLPCPSSLHHSRQSESAGLHTVIRSTYIDLLMIYTRHLSLGKSPHRKFLVLNIFAHSTILPADSLREAEGRTVHTCHPERPDLKDSRWVQ